MQRNRETYGKPEKKCKKKLNPNVQIQKFQTYSNILSHKNPIYFINLKLPL